MDTRHLRSFLKIAELGSITRAADALGIAQPSLSLQLLRLEDETGVKLFERGARGARLTQAGRIFLEHAERMILMADQALEDVQHVRADAAGRVSFAIPASLPAMIGAHLLESVKRYTPRITLHLIEASSGQIVDWVGLDMLDLAIIYALESTRHLCVRTLARETLYLVGPAGTFGDPTTAPAIATTELAAFPLILPSARNGLAQCVDSAAYSLGITLARGPEIDASAQIRNLVASGKGFTLLPLSTVAPGLQGGQLSAVRIEGDPFSRTLCLARQPGVEVNPAVERVEWLALTLMSRLIRKGRWIAEPAAGLTEHI